MHALSHILDLTAAAGLAAIADAREDVADYTATGELDHGHRDLYLEHLDMIETAARSLCALI
jgi:predicted nicotinamide N-methyase